MKSFLKIFLFFFITTSTSEAVLAQSIVWRQIIGGPYVDIGRNCIELRDGNYLMAGEKEILITNPISVVQKSYLVKFDPYGFIIWERLIGDSSVSNTSLSLTEDPFGNIFLPYRSGFS